MVGITSSSVVTMCAHIHVLLLPLFCGYTHGFRQTLKTFYKPFGPIMCKVLCEEPSQYCFFTEEQLSCRVVASDSMGDVGFVTKKESSVKLKGRCPLEKSYIQEESLGLCFKRHMTKVTNNQGTQLCKNEGGQLMTLKTKRRFFFIYKYMKTIHSNNQKYFIWLGMRRVQKKKKYIWRGGGHFVGQWAPGDPSFGMEKCVALGRRGMADIHCIRLAETLCEIQM